MEHSTDSAQYWLRHPQLQADLLAFHQQFPPLFRRTTQGTRYRHTPPPLLGLERLFDFRVLPAGELAVVPRTFDAVPLRHTLTIEVYQLGYQQRLEAGPRQVAYFKALGTKASLWRHRWDALRDRWPHVPQAFLRSGHPDDLSPHLFDQITPEDIPVIWQSRQDHPPHTSRGRPLGSHSHPTLETMTQALRELLQNNPSPRKKDFMEKLGRSLDDQRRVNEWLKPYDMTYVDLVRLVKHPS